MRGQWAERFERRCGFWRGFVDEQVRRYLDCGLFENGFARIRCPDCAEEYLLAFSCKTRELCPSCAAKRSAATAALLAEEVFTEVGHAQWVFVMPKMLKVPGTHLQNSGRPYRPAKQCRAPFSYSLGTLFEAKWDWGQAEYYYRRALEEFGDQRAPNNLGIALLHQNRLSEAELYFRLGLKLGDKIAGENLERLLRSRE